MGSEKEFQVTSAFKVVRPYSSSMPQKNNTSFSRGWWTQMVAMEKQCEAYISKLNEIIFHGIKFII